MTHFPLIDGSNALPDGRLAIARRRPPGTGIHWEVTILDKGRDAGSASGTWHECAAFVSGWVHASTWIANINGAIK